MRVLDGFATYDLEEFHRELVLVLVLHEEAERLAAE
ncbi:hypothetical protein SAMN05444920_11665 [Nonomuraea solani]|uniref:Uncharacterized protein n=1 Tax=Nonomuraea solani TaxID=1144553 RepID=A0A1H6ETC7_9ACTN|nr:hypothetical protein SAMN05444920_11665 [Nonomuraea solani]